MLNRWEIEPAPTSADPTRRRLRVRSALADVHALIRRVGAACGRPRREPPGSAFSYSLYLNGLGEEGLGAVEAALRELGGQPAARPAQPAPEAAPVPAFEAATELALEPPPPGEPEPALGSLESIPAPGGPTAAPGAPPLFGACRTPDPQRTIEAFSVGAANRFAHAAVMAALTNPGSLYNPLFFSGPPGCGKTHLLGAMGQKLQTQAPDQPVLFTSGSRLARAASAAAAAGRGEELEAFTARSRALIIDDFHLLEVSDGNRELLARMVKAYLGGGRQVVLASLYPTKLLGPIEEALGLRIAQGHAVEMKEPGEKTQREIAEAALARSGLEVEPRGRGMFVDRILGEFPRLDAHLRRMRTLQALKAAAGQPNGLADLVLALFGPEEPPEAVSEEQLKESLGPEVPSGPVPVALIYPAGAETAVEWAWRRIADAARELFGKFPFQASPRVPYDPAEGFSAPFTAARAVRQSGVRAALALGPSPGTDLAAHEEDFRYVLEHLLQDDGSQAVLGWIPYPRIRQARSRLLAYLDLMSAAPA